MAIAVIENVIVQVARARCDAECAVLHIAAHAAVFCCALRLVQDQNWPRSKRNVGIYANGNSCVTLAAQFVNRGFSERTAKMIDYLSRISFPLSFLAFEIAMFVPLWIDDNDTVEQRT